MERGKTQESAQPASMKNVKIGWAAAFIALPKADKPLKPPKLMHRVIWEHSAQIGGAPPAAEMVVLIRGEKTPLCR